MQNNFEVDFIKAYEKLENEFNNFLSKNKNVTSKGALELDTIWFNTLFANPLVAVYLKENGIQCYSFDEFQLRSEQICKQIKDLYAKVKH